MLKLGATLLHRYRVDRFCAERHGVLMYEATDVIDERPVCVKIVRNETLADATAFESFKLEADRPSAIDFGSVGGLPFFVATEWDRSLRPPPPLPRPTPPPPRPEAVTIPLIEVDLETLQEPEPEPAPEPEPEPEPVRAAPKKKPPWLAIMLVAVVVTGAGGWLYGRQTRAAIAWTTSATR